LRLEQIDIQTLPGIEPGFTLEGISPGSNLITGPNGVGKSSLIRALIYLLGESQGDDPVAMSLAAVFEGNDGRWTVRRTGSQIAWEKEGRPAERPPLPGRDQFYCYWVSMENLLQADQGDERLATELKRALSGGYDIDALREDTPFRLRARHGHNEAVSLRSAGGDLRAVEAEYESLRRDESDIPALKERVEAARSAAARVEHLQKALDLLQTNRDRQRVEARLSEFDENMNLLRGDELTRLQGLDDRREDLNNELERQTRALEEAERSLQDTGLTAGRPEFKDLRARENELQQAQRKTDQFEEKQSQLESAATAESQALGFLGGDTKVPSLDPSSISQAEILAGRLQNSQRRQQDLKDVLEEAEEAPDDESIDRHIQAAEALRAQLANESGISVSHLAGILTAGAGAVVATAMTLIERAWLGVFGGIIALLGVFWALYNSRRSASRISRRRLDICGIEGPETWQREAVQTRLREIETARIELQQRRLRAQQAEEDRVKLNRVETKLESLEQEKNAMAEQLGFDPELTATALDRFVRLVQEYEQAHNDQQSTQAAITRLEGEITTLTGRVRKFLDSWEAAPGEEEGLDSLVSYLDDLRRRSQEAETADREARNAGRELERINEYLVTIDEEEATLFAEAGLEAGERTELTHRCEQFEAWSTQQRELRDARVLEAERRRTIENEQDFLDKVEADDEESLRRDLQLSNEKAQELELLQEELTTIRTQLREAGRDHKLELALANVDSARTDLEDRYHQALFADAAGLLLDRVQHEYRSEHEPEVLRDARERFLQFTHHSFALELDATEGFMARDLRQQARRNLSELSSATRMHLLLAMRVAWTRRIEQGRESLPLFLDEALTTSDEQRFVQVAKSLEQLAHQEGRQIFYLSARRQEIALWERATGHRPHHIDLAAVRFGPGDIAPENFVLPQIEILPAPSGHSPESYAAELGVPPVNAQQSAGLIHLFYILRDDLDLLYRLMENWRTTTLGQFESLLHSSSVAQAIHDVQCRQRMEARCKTVRVWVAAWRRGRGKTVNRIVLESSGGVSETFIDRVSELVDSLDGSAEALIRDLRAGEISRFRSNHTDELAQWLEAEGYLDPDEVLSCQDRERSTLLDVAGHATLEDTRQVVRWLEAGQQETGN
jgi:DNA repair exonuclease SbcCD ATPase subunit